MNEWKDISTAPTDGKEIILGYEPVQEKPERKNSDAPLIYKMIYLKEDGLIKPGFKGIDQWDIIDLYADYYPSHWMPLPKPPVKKHKCSNESFYCEVIDNKLSIQEIKSSRWKEVNYCPICGEKS